MTNWQPIKTAPKDGTRILLFMPKTNFKIYVGQYLRNEDRSEAWYCGGFGTLSSTKPSHWASLPEPPRRTRARMKGEKGK
jgi:hypothetical protein